MTVEGRPVLQAPCALLPHHHDWHAYLPDVYIFLPALTDQTYKINCPFCHDSDGVNAKEFTPGRRTLADGRSYWFIGRRYRCLLCQQLVRERGYNGAGLPDGDEEEEEEEEEEEDGSDSPLQPGKLVETSLLSLGTRLREARGSRSSPRHGVIQDLQLSSINGNRLTNKMTD